MKRKAKTRSGHHIQRLLLILLLIAFLALMLVTEVRRSQAAIGRERVAFSTYTYTDVFSGYVFREEAEITDGGNNGPVEYLAANGSTVLARAPLAVTYAEVTGDGEREQAAALLDEINRLERSLLEDDWQANYMTSYSAMMSAISAGNWRAGIDAADLLSASLAQSSVATVAGSEDAVRARISALRVQFDEMVKWAKDTAVTVSAPADGRFCITTDGYEGTFSLPNAVDVTPESLELWLENDAPTAGAVGKVVSCGTFYLAVPVTAQEAAFYTEGNTYRVRMLRGGETDMMLERISLAAEGDARALLVLRAEQMPEGMDLERRQPIVVERETVSGLAIPVTALQTEGDETFVFVVRNGVAERRRVTVLCQENGCCIVAVRNEAGYLREGEQMLISTRRVYEGKVLSK